MALTRKIQRALPMLGLALLALAMFDGYGWWHAKRLNKAIGDESILEVKHALPAEGIFAQAYLRAQKGDREHAIALYKQVEAMADKVLAQTAKYNRANLYLFKAMELNGTDNPNLALPFAELAKDTYRALLRNTPNHWDAKYNLERALRLVPDPDDSDDADLPPPLQSERAPTTMRGFTLGLP